MNVLDILHTLGYDVISFSDGVYKIQNTTAKINRLRKQIESGKIGYEGSIYDQYEVRVGEVHFNGLGNLYVDFVSLDGEKIIDGYEYRNMNADDLY